MTDLRYNKGLYIHIPFCRQKCKYCDFNSFCGTCSEHKAYLNALFSELDLRRGSACDTVFIGGGTPTALSAEDMERLLKKINENFLLAKDTEFTVEANPKTVDKRKLSVMLENGVNRISFGVQSFSDAELSAIGRIHSAEDARESFYLAREAGFDNISIDLMMSIPLQTLRSLEKNIEIAARLAPEHISCYSLILEEGTPLYDEYLRGEIELPDEEAQRDMYDMAVEVLARYGYARYEISNFAKPGMESRHNMKYWQCKEYIGAGLSAHSYLNSVRFCNTDSFSSYIQGNFKSGEETRLSPNDMMSEFMFMGLRMEHGISKADFKARFGKEIENIFGNQLLKFKKLGMIKEENGRIFLSNSAIPVSNAVMCEFIL